MDEFIIARGHHPRSAQLVALVSGYILVRVTLIQSVPPVSPSASTKWLTVSIDIRTSFGRGPAVVAGYRDMNQQNFLSKL